MVELKFKFKAEENDHFLFIGRFTVPMGDDDSEISGDDKGSMEFAFALGTSGWATDERNDWKSFGSGGTGGTVPVPSFSRSPMDAARSLTMDDVSLPLRLGGPTEDGVRGLALCDDAVEDDVRFSGGAGGGGVFSLDFARALRPSSFLKASAVSESIACLRCEPEFAPRRGGAAADRGGNG